MITAAFVIAPVMLARDFVQNTLRGDTMSVVLGILFFAIGLVSLGLYLLRSRRERDAAALWFGVSTVLQGSRLLSQTRVVPFLCEPVPLEFWPYLIAGLTYVIPVAGVMFLWALPGWQKGLRWALYGAGGLAVAGLAGDQIRRRPESLHFVNNILVLAGWTAFLIAVFSNRKSVQAFRSIRVPLLILAAAIAVNNIASLGFFHLPFDPEPLALTVFFAGLGRILAMRTFEDQKKLTTIHNELEIARRIQLSILPQDALEIGAMRIATRYLPMTAVAGDFYEFLVAGEEQVGVLVADVSGHGVPAALFASMVKVAIAGQSAHASDPARVLQGINQTLCGKMQGKFVTAAYLYLDFETWTFRYGAAGHPPLLWLHGRNGSLEEVVENGLILGVMPVTRYSFVERQFAVGDRFLMYTDGLLEAPNAAGQFYGDGRLQEAVLRASVDTERAADELLEGLRAWSGMSSDQGQDDDLTLLVIDAISNPKVR